MTGACFLVRRQAFDAVGGFDDRYFMYVEEVDLCWRLAKAGWRTAYEPSARVLHLAGISTAAVPYRMIAAHHLSLWRFARRTTSGPDRLWLPVVAAGIAGRWGFVFSAVSPRSSGASGQPDAADRRGLSAPCLRRPFARCDR